MHGTSQDYATEHRNFCLYIKQGIEINFTGRTLEFTGYDISFDPLHSIKGVGAARVAVDFRELDRQEIVRSIVRQSAH